MEVWKIVREASSLTANHCHSTAEKDGGRKEGKKKKKENTLQMLKGDSNYLFTSRARCDSQSRRCLFRILSSLFPISPESSSPFHPQRIH